MILLCQVFILQLLSGLCGGFGWFGHSSYTTSRPRTVEPHRPVGDENPVAEGFRYQSYKPSQQVYTTEKSDVQPYKSFFHQRYTTTTKPKPITENPRSTTMTPKLTTKKPKQVVIDPLVMYPSCRTETRVEFRDWCEPYTEETCWTQNQETCVLEEYKNCTGVIETDVERVCFDVTEMLCSLEEIIHYEMVEESYQMMHCFTAIDRVCDTVYNIDTLTKDDYQCLTVETPNCYQEEQVINDVTCTDTIEFQCDRKMLTEYGTTEVVCARFPKKDCYNVPRKVLVEVCERDQYKYCDKFTNLVPYPVEDQNCHFEPKKICEIREMSSPKQAKKYSYTKECKKVDRKLCDQVEKNFIKPNCDEQERLKCTYEPVKKCDEKDEVFCDKQEVVVEEEVCDDKFASKY